MKIRHALCVVLHLVSINALADWTDPGAAYNCDPQKRMLSITSVMDTSSPEDPGTVRAPSGYLGFAFDSRSALKCTFGHTSVQARVRVSSGRASGTCGGIPRTVFETFRVNGKEVFGAPTTINFRCLNDEDLFSIEVTEEKGVIQTKVCYAQWDWGVGYHGVRCERR